MATDVVELLEPVDVVPFPPTGETSPIVMFAPLGAEPEGAVPFPTAVIVMLAPPLPDGGEPDGALPFPIVLLPLGPLLPPPGLMLLVKAYPPSAVYSAAAWMV